MEIENFFKHDYHDRGMKKWSGFILAEHSATEENEAKKRQHKNLAKPQLSNLEIKTCLDKAVLKNLPVAIQIEALDEQGNYYDDVVGSIRGADELGIYIDKQKVGYDEIRHVQLVKPVKWSQLD